MEVEVQNRELGTIVSICEVTLEARDGARMVDFYTRALGCPVIASEPDRTWLACGSRARLGIWSPGEKEFGDRGGRHVHFALSASRAGLDGLVERWRRLGLSFRGPVEHPGGDRSLYLEDVEGNVLEIWDFFEDGPGAEEGVEALS